MHTFKHIPVKDIFESGALGVTIGAVVATIAVKRGSSLFSAISLSAATAVAVAAARNARHAPMPQPNKVQAMVRSVNRLKFR